MTNYCSGEQIEKSDMGGACSRYGGEERCIHDLWWGNLEEIDHLEDSGLDGRIILRWSSGIGDWGGSME